jgi:hypothetical protein
MKIYLLYVHDDRYSVPTLDTISVRNDAQAIELAIKRLAASPHYQAVDLWEGDRLVAGFDHQTLNVRPES